MFEKVSSVGSSGGGGGGGGDVIRNRTSSGADKPAVRAGTGAVRSLPELDEPAGQLLHPAEERVHERSPVRLRRLRQPCHTQGPGARPHRRPRPRRALQHHWRVAQSLQVR